MSLYRIWILDECHQLSTSAQNALLKCLEEPPAHVVFILCTTEAHKVLPTIISRCQTFNFRALSVDAIVGQLHKISSAESIEIASEAMRAIARTCDGGLRDALQLLSQLSLLNSEITLTQVAEVSGSISEQDSIALLKAIHSGDTLSVLQSSRTLIDSGKTPKLILSSLLAAMRDLLIVKSTRHCQNLIAGPVGYSQLRSLALHLDFETIDAACTQLQKSEFQLRTSTNAATWLEVCLLNLMLSCKPAAPETRLPATSQSNQPDKFDKTPQKIEADSPDFETTWAQIVAAAKPGNRSLLNRAQIAELSADSCVLAVERKYANKFQSHLESVQRIVTKALRPLCYCNCQTTGGVSSMISILIGNDTYAIEREVENFKTQTHPLWRDFNIHRRNASSLMQPSLLLLQFLSAVETNLLSLKIAISSNLEKWG